MAKSTAAPRLRRRERKNITSGTAHVSASFNNTMITITDAQGNTIAWSSSGSQGFKGSRKSTPYAAQVAAEDAGKKAMEHGMRTLDIEVKGPGSGRESALRALQAVGFAITSIRDVTAIRTTAAARPSAAASRRRRAGSVGWPIDRRQPGHWCEIPRRLDHRLTLRTRSAPLSIEVIVLQKNWQTLIKPKQLSVEPGDDAKRVATVVAEPLERGFGLTLGNALRRVLLSSLQGAAVTSLQIDGVLHEFSSLPGVLEDVTDIVLNVKSIGLRMHGEGPKRMRLRAAGPGEVRARQIETGHDIEILNPDLVICTLDNGARIAMELTVENGKGYVPGNDNRPEDAPIGLIPVDALFSPVRKVSYRVENTRVGQQTDLDRLVMRVETNGAITPEDSVALAARILQDQLHLFINFEEPRHAVEEKFGRAADQQEPVAQGRRIGTVGALGQLPEERQYRLHWRPRAEDRGRDAADPQFRAQVAERDQGSAGQYGAPSRHGDPGLAAREHRRATQRAPSNSHSLSIAQPI